jgi:hypothetical protein
VEQAEETVVEEVEQEDIVLHSQVELQLKLLMV